MSSSFGIPWFIGKNQHVGNEVQGDEDEVEDVEVRNDDIENIQLISSPTPVENEVHPNENEVKEGTYNLNCIWFTYWGELRVQGVANHLFVVGPNCYLNSSFMDISSTKGSRRGG